MCKSITRLFLNMLRYFLHNNFIFDYTVIAKKKTRINFIYNARKQEKTLKSICYKDLKKTCI